MRASTYSRRNRDGQPDEPFDLKKVLASFAGLPRVLRLVWEANPPLMIGMALFTLVGGFTPLATVIIARLLIDGALTAIREGSIAPIWLPVILQLGVGLLNAFSNTISSLFQSLLQDRVSNHVQSMVLRKANTLDLSFFENPEFYDKLSHASEEAANRPIAMISQTFGLGRTLITLLSMLGLILHLAWWLAIVALIVPIPSFIASSRYGLKNYRMMRWQSPEKRQQMYLNRLMTVDDFNKEIKLFNLGDFFIRRYQFLAEKFYEENKRLQVARNLNNFLWSALSIAANSGIYLYVALQAVTRVISLGALSQYTMAVNQAGQNFQGVLDGISSMYENHLFVNTLFEFLEYQPKIVSPKHPVPIETPLTSKGLDIEFRNVSFTYPDKAQPTLKNVSFTLRSGEAIALVGRNGAGKTTLVKLLTRLYDPDEGEILIGGRNVKEYDLHELRDHIGVIFQDYVKYNMKASENIGVGRVGEVENLELIDAAAHKSGADTVIGRLQEGYDSMLGRWFDKGMQLSGGEWQKVALARAFMRDARILILDEPTSALDAQAEYDVFTRFRHLTEGKTAIFISHRFSTVRLADRIFVIENGEVIENGSHQELMALDGRYAQLFNLQAEAYR
ncbi:MAG TPA: ABC transporter ATP-binding protein [Ktedonobacteraceae bacterium]